jgi:hypothetical protein
MLIDKNASKNMAWVQRFHYIGRLKVYPVFGVRDKFQAKNPWKPYPIRISRIQRF